MSSGAVPRAPNSLTDAARRDRLREGKKCTCQLAELKKVKKRNGTEQVRDRREGKQRERERERGAQ